MRDQKVDKNSKEYYKHVQKPPIGLRIKYGPLECPSLIDFEKIPKSTCKIYVFRR